MKNADSHAQSDSIIQWLSEKNSTINADFSDIRYETKKVVRVLFSKTELKEVSSNTTDGYVIRVLNDGGISTITITRPGDIERAIRKAQYASKLLSEKSKNKVRLADVKPVKDRVEPDLNISPEDVALEDKISLTKSYNDLLLKQADIAATSLTYSETTRNRYYVNSEGTEISERLVTVSISGEAVAKRGSLVQNVRCSIGGADGMKKLYGREDVFLKKAKIAMELLDAKPVTRGTFDAVLNPSMTGVLMHEAFGHFSEADIIEDVPSLRKKMQLGAKLGSDIVNITADSTMPGQVGYYKYDDEGVPVKRVQLMTNGVLTGRLHSRRTAASFNEEPTGHCVAEDYRFGPIVRMGTIFTEKGRMKMEEIIRDTHNGLYICDAKGGQTAGENFTFGSQYGYEIKNGELCGIVRDINIMGNLFSTLKNIWAVADDFTLSEIGGCGKGQLNIKSGHGGTHIGVRGMVFGGV